MTAALIVITATNLTANAITCCLSYKYRFAATCFLSTVGSGSRSYVHVSATRREREMELEQVNEKGTLQKDIAEFYDEASGIWEDIWGDHMHHGFYDPDSTVSASDHRVAQIRMIEEALRFAGVSGTPRLQSTLSTKLTQKSVVFGHVDATVLSIHVYAVGLRS